MTSLVEAALLRRQQEADALVSIDLDADRLLLHGYEARRKARVPNYKKPREIIICQHCGKQAIKVRRYERPNKFCSRRCSALSVPPERRFKRRQA